ncbi:MAG: hypothetical protein D3914_05905 [Candidatus Electrothrix sp. LOE2]|nr:hypothetical protein [Candidatus Electrothrix sp. LOE2]
MKLTNANTGFLFVDGVAFVCGNVLPGGKLPWRLGGKGIDRESVPRLYFIGIGVTQLKTEILSLQQVALRQQKLSFEQNQRVIEPTA